jgi:hypothetical protein
MQNLDLNNFDRVGLSFISSLSVNGIPKFAIYFLLIAFGNPVISQDYFPHAIGNTYTYQRVALTTVETTVTMDQFYCCDDFQAILFERTSPSFFPPRLVLDEEEKVRADGTFCNSKQGIWGVKNPVDGDEQVYQDDENDRFIIYRAQNIGNYTVPAGTFQDCFRITNETFSVLSNGDTLAPIRIELTLAPNVGLIEINIGSSPLLHYHLTAYNVSPSEPMPDCVSTSTTVSTNTSLSKVVLSPNPAQSIVNFQNLDSDKKTSYSLIDISGKLQQSGVLEQHQIDVNQLTPGMYFLLLDNGSEQVYRKLIIK